MFQSQLERAVKQLSNKVRVLTKLFIEAKQRKQSLLFCVLVSYSRIMMILGKLGLGVTSNHAETRECFCDAEPNIKFPWHVRQWCKRSKPACWRMAWLNCLYNLLTSSVIIVKNTVETWEWMLIPGVLIHRLFKIATHFLMWQTLWITCQEQSFLIYIFWYLDTIR